LICFILIDQLLDNVEEIYYILKVYPEL